MDDITEKERGEVLEKAYILQKETGEALRLQDEYIEEERKKALEFEMMSENSDIEAEKLVTEWATKIYRAADDVYRASVALCSFETREQSEKCRAIMAGKRLGEFVQIVKSPHFLYLKIGNYEMEIDYYPGRYHIEQIKKFLSEQKENWLCIAQEIIEWINSIPSIARIVRRNILYPEFAEMEKEIGELKHDLCFQKNKIDYLENVEEILKKENAKLKEALKEKNQQLETSLGMLAHMTYEINGSLMRVTELFYALRNKLGK